MNHFLSIICGYTSFPSPSPFPPTSSPLSLSLRLHFPLPPLLFLPPSPPLSLSSATYMASMYSTYRDDIDAVMATNTLTHKGHSPVVLWQILRGRVANL